MKILHVISSLGHAGAETMLHKLLSRRDPAVLEAEVVSLTAEIGAAGKRIQSLGVPVHALGLDAARLDPRPLLGLARRLRRDPPDLVQTWMYHADLLGGLVARLTTRAPVVWNLRHSDFDPRIAKRSQRLVVAACARLSWRLPERIVCCSEASRREHVRRGYAPHPMTVIPNGFDLDAFRPDSEARAAVRAELGIPETSLVVGLAARHHPQKDHATFLRAARLVADAHPDVRFLLCGGGVDPGNRSLVERVRREGLEGRCALLGRRDDIQRVDAALDVACSSSAFGEGFSNAVGEAMACGTPCVVTDVGDSARIVGETGRVVPRRDPQAMGAAVLELVSLPPDARRALGLAARRRIAERYSLALAVERYEHLWTATADPRRTTTARDVASRDRAHRLPDAP